MLSAQDRVTCAGKIWISSSLKCPRYWTLVHLSTAVETQFYSFLLSDAFDFQFGSVILRLKEGLDVSHIQGQGKEEAGINGMEVMWFSGACCPGNLVIPTEPQRF